MKKFFVFLMTIVSIFFICSSNVYADSFYEGESFGTYMKTFDGTTTRYFLAKIFRRSSDNHFAYCMEPFLTFQDNATYSVRTPFDFGYIPERALKIAYFGYGYGNHTDAKWWAITQLMIWRETYPNNDFYFTDTFNGNRIEVYNNEMNEINNLVNNYVTVPNLVGENSTVEGGEIILTDTNNIISNFKTYDSNISIVGNKVIIKNVKKGTTTIKFSSKKSPDYGTYYQSKSNSQSLLIPGDAFYKSFNYNIYATSNSITIKKIDEDNDSNISRGDASLSNSIFGLYDESDNLLEEIVIDERLEYTINNLNYGKYYIKEIDAGEGYTINDKKYNLTVDKNTDNILITISNKVIEKRIIIHKEYGEKDNTKSEKDISFDIFDSNNNLVDTITTDEEGNASITLPYGKYRVSQRNTNSGYNMVDDFYITINEDTLDDYQYNLYDIKVPDTGIKENNSILLVILLLIPLALFKLKKCF